MGPVFAEGPSRAVSRRGLFTGNTIQPGVQGNPGRFESALNPERVTFPKLWTKNEGRAVQGRGGLGERRV